MRGFSNYPILRSSSGRKKLAITNSSTTGFLNSPSMILTSRANMKAWPIFIGASIRKCKLMNWLMRSRNSWNGQKLSSCKSPVATYQTRPKRLRMSAIRGTDRSQLHVSNRAAHRQPVPRGEGDHNLT
jgi:hypothetical protein